MRALAFDTATPAVAVALVSWAAREPERGPAGSSTVLAAREVVDGRRSGELLAPLIVEVLDEAGVDRRDVDLVGVGLGPGPFTSLRVGVVTAAALADALGVPAYGACSLDAVPRPCGRDTVVVTDARRREVYWARYDATGRRTDGPAVSRPAELAVALHAEPAPPVVVGPGLEPHAEHFAGLAGTDGPAWPAAARLAELAFAAARTGPPPGPLVPLYLRRPDAVEPAALGPLRPVLT